MKIGAAAHDDPSVGAERRHLPSLRKGRKSGGLSC